MSRGLRVLSRVLAVAGICLFTAAAQLSCSSNDDDDHDPGDGSDFDVTLALVNTQGNERSSFEFGQTIVWQLTVTNQSGSTQVLSLPTTQIYDLAIFDDGAQTPRWRWSFNRVFNQVPTDLTFAPHQSITYTFIWSGVLEDGTQLMPGTYDVRGTLAYVNYASSWRGNNALASPIRRVTITN